MKQITFKQYRSFDVAALCLLTAVFEGLATYLAKAPQWAAQPLAISLTLSMTCIALVRWSALGVLPALCGSLAYCIASGGTPSQYLIYCLGSLLCLAAVPLLKRIDKEKIRLSFTRRLLFILLIHLLIGLGRWLVSLAFDPAISSVILFLLSPTDLFAVLFATVILFIAKGLDGVLEDQKTYLLRVERERNDEKEFSQNDDF